MLRLKSTYSCLWLLFCYALLLQIVLIDGSAFFCSKEIYGVPALADCNQAINSLPTTDQSLRYFIEQQLATAPPLSDWHAWRDSRPIEEQRKPIQVPKFWAFGKAHLP